MWSLHALLSSFELWTTGPPHFYSFPSFYSCSFLCVCWWCGMGYGSEKVCCGSVYSIWGVDNTDPTVSRKRIMQRILIIPGNCVLSSHHSTEWVSTELSLLRNTGFGSCEPLATFSSADQIHMLVSCVLLLKDILFTVYCWFISI